MSFVRTRHLPRAAAAVAAASLLLAACGDDAPDVEAPTAADDEDEDDTPDAEPEPEPEADPEPEDEDDEDDEDDDDPPAASAEGVPDGFAAAADVTYDADAVATDDGDYDAFLATFDDIGVVPIVPQDAVAVQHTSLSSSESVRFLFPAADADAIFDAFDAYYADTYDIDFLGDRATTTSGDQSRVNQTYREGVEDDAPLTVRRYTIDVSIDAVEGEDQMQLSVRVAPEG